ncbi:hypothetical protein BB934_45435 (plasmid) [Microvirga ossetica]|uniref:Uncharacterized protein n=1 Tax=Microvirga ossetica TaxID=1882682 RepID=A0A1B2EZP5_9HYPH|nr:hypothetical protein [Microvirga ossetica]ANY85465.1 hypothetical protein BB934_45435 [Microvirga ossetica]
MTDKIENASIRNIKAADAFVGLFIVGAATCIHHAMNEVGFFDLGTILRDVGGGVIHPAAAFGIAAAFLGMMGILALGVISGVSYAFGKVRGFRQ